LRQGFGGHRLTVTGAEDDRYAVAVFTYAGDQFDTGHFRHGLVGDEQIESHRGLPETLQRRDALSKGSHPVSQTLQADCGRIDGQKLAFRCYPEDPDGKVREKRMEVRPGRLVGAL